MKNKMKYPEIESWYRAANLRTKFKIGNAEELQRVLEFDVFEVDGLQGWSEERLKLVERFVCGFLNRFGLVDRQNHLPKKIEWDDTNQWLKYTEEDGFYHHLPFRGSWLDDGIRYGKANTPVQEPTTVFVFKEFSFSEDELFDLAKNYNYWKFDKEGSCLVAFTPERLKELISTGFLIHEPEVPYNDSYLVAEDWRDEFKQYLETSSFPKEIADTIRRGY